MIYIINCPYYNNNKCSSQFHNFTLFAGLNNHFCRKKPNNSCKDITYYILHAMCLTVIIRGCQEHTDVIL